MVERVPFIYIVKNTFPKEVLTEAMVDEVDTSL